MKARRAVARSALLAPLCLGLSACASAAAGGSAPRAPPVSARSAPLAVRVSARTLTAYRLNLRVDLVTRRVLPLVEVRAESADRNLRIGRGCTFHPLRPPERIDRRAPPYALPLVPLCSLTVSASRAGRYGLEVRVFDGAGHELLAPIRVLVSFPRKAG